MFRLITMAAICAVTACSDAAGPRTHVGSYALISVNGNGLPVTVARYGNDAVEITAGMITLNPDLTFSDRTTVRVTNAGQVTTEDEVYTGTYEVTGGAVRLTASTGEQYGVALSGSTLTQTVGTIVLIYRR
jgi:hypothetical protein